MGASGDVNQKNEKSGKWSPDQAKSIESIGIVIIQTSNRVNRFSLKTTTMCRWVALGSIHIIRRRGDGEGVTTSGSDIYLRKTGSGV